jgi:hypothetical protein
MKSMPLATGTLALCAAFGADAQKVYRCGPDGRIYQQTACADGKEVEASDPRTAEQRRAGQAVAKSEAKAAAELDRDTMAASAARKGKAKPQAAPVPKDKAASSAKAPSTRADAPSKPLVFLVPLPKGAASAAQPALAGAPFAVAGNNRLYFSHSVSRLSTCAGSTGMQLTGQT